MNAAPSMKRGRRVLISLCALMLLGGCCAAVPPQHPPANLGDFKLKLLRYHDSGAYEAAVKIADAAAKRWIADRVRSVNRPAIILDIDETSLSNWPELRANDLTFRLDGPCDRLPKGPCGLEAWQELAAAPALQPTVDLFHAAKASGASVFFITGRDGRHRAATVRNLRKAGYGGWAGLVMRPTGTSTPSAGDYKAEARAAIEAEGFHIIANIGDQPSDLIGGHADRAFLVPNPFYRIP